MATPAVEDQMETVAADGEAVKMETVGYGVGEEEDDLLPDPGDGGDSSSSEEEVPAPTDLSEGLSAEECVAAACDAKAAGNEYFKAGESADACQKYQLGVQYLRRHSSDPAARELLLSVQTNLAAAQIKLELWADAVVAATAALELDPSSTKALFRRGLARSRLSEWDLAKTDLTAACRLDPRNREARAELAVVQAQLAQMREVERERLSKLFVGKSLYAAEEKQRQRKQAEEARAEEVRRAQEVEKEEALRVEWAAECRRLRAEEAERRNARPEAAAEARAGGAAGGNGEGEEAGTKVGEEASGGEVAAAEAAAESAVEEAPPISFEEYKKSVEERKKAAKEAEDKAEEEARAAARHERMLRAQATEVLSEDEDLTGLVRGYKKRADGSTTSYFDREVDEQTKAMLDRLKAPKRITINGGDGGAEADGGRIAPVGGGGGVASAWNRAGTTWEDKDVTKWATGRLTELLGAARAETDTDDSRGGSASPLPDLPPPPPPDYAPPLLGAPDRPFPLRAAVCSVKSCDGTATITSSRGVLRHALDYCFKLEWEITAQGDEAQSFKGLAHTEKYSGTLAYTDVTSPTQLELQVSYAAGKTPSAVVAPRVSQALDALKAQINAALDGFMDEFKRKGMH